jgi:hypothetical protein
MFPSPSSFSTYNPSSFPCLFAFTHDLLIIRNSSMWPLNRWAGIDYWWLMIGKNKMQRNTDGIFKCHIPTGLLAPSFTVHSISWWEGPASHSSWHWKSSPNEEIKMEMSTLVALTTSCQQATTCLGHPEERTSNSLHPYMGCGTVHGVWVHSRMSCTRGASIWLM